MPTANNPSSEAEIKALIEKNVEAIRAKDIAEAISDHAPNVLLFDVINPLRYSGLDALKDRLNDWFSSFQGSIGYELQDLNITASEDVAFCHCLNQVKGTKTDGVAIEMWWRATVCYRKIDGRWLVTHAHSSVPFNTENGQASLDLQP